MIFTSYTSFLAQIPALLKERTALLGKTPLGREGGWSHLTFLFMARLSAAAASPQFVSCPFCCCPVSSSLLRAAVRGL